MRRILVAALLFIPLAGCAEQAPAPVVAYGYAGGAASSGMHTVIGQETLWSIAQSYKLPMQEIIRINQLQPPYALRPNQRIKLPVPHEYKAKPGDTLYSISRMFDVSPNELARMNDMHEPFAMAAGQVLRLPELPMPRAAPSLPPAQTEYSVASVAGGAQQFALYGEGGDARPVHAPVSSSYPAPPSQESARGEGEVERENLDTPIIAAPLAAPVYAPAYASAYPSGDEENVRTASLPPQVEATLQNLQPQQRQALAALPADTPPRAGSRFGWPVNGSVVSAYGTKAGGLHNDGINIRAPEGAPVVAADNGVIVYADNQLKGYGNLVLVRHADRWMTAYAHMNSIGVQRGQVVRKGERLGTVGETGGVSVPQLHFEVRHGTEALNPEAFMERQGT